jgi:hypothetical protein
LWGRASAAGKRSSLHRRGAVLPEVCARFALLLSASSEPSHLRLVGLQDEAEDRLDDRFDDSDDQFDQFDDQFDDQDDQFDDMDDNDNDDGNDMDDRD